MPTLPEARHDDVDRHWARGRSMRDRFVRRSSAGEPADPCAVPGYLLFGDSQLERVAAAVKKDKALRIAVLGGASSTLPGQDGATFAYPARLEAALSRRLPGVKVTVRWNCKPARPPRKCLTAIDKLLARPQAEFGDMANWNLRCRARNRP